MVFDFDPFINTLFQLLMFNIGSLKDQAISAHRLLGVPEPPKTTAPPQSCSIDFLKSLEQLEQRTSQLSEVLQTRRRENKEANRQLIELKLRTNALQVKSTAMEKELADLQATLAKSKYSETLQEGKSIQPHLPSHVHQF